MSKRSGDGFDAAVGAQQYVGLRPVLEDANDALSGGANDATRCVEQAPTQCLWAGKAPIAVTAQELEPSDEVRGEHHDGHPVGVRRKAREGEAAQPRVLQPGDVVLDMCMGAHYEIELSGLAPAVGVEAPVAVLEGRKQAALGAGVQRLSPHDEPCPLRQRREADERGELTDRGTVSLLAVL